MKGRDEGTGRHQRKGETEELWGREAEIRKATNSKGHKVGSRWRSLSHRIKSRETIPERGHQQTSGSLRLGGRCQHVYRGNDCRHSVVDHRRDKVKIIVILGHTFLQKQGRDEVKLLLLESLFTLMGNWKCGWLEEGKRLRKTVVKLDHRLKEKVEDRGQGSRCCELGENEHEEAWRRHGLVADILVREGRLRSYLLLAVGSGVSVTKMREARKLVKGIE